MWLLDMEDERGRFQVLWSGEPLVRYRRLLSAREPVLIHGHIRRDRHGQIVLMGQRISILS